MTYFDSRGVEMEAVPTSEALKTVLELAIANQLPKGEAKMSELEDIREWQQTAIETVGGVIENFASEIDALEMPQQLGMDGDLSIKRSDDPTVFSIAVRIVYELGYNGALDPAEANSIELAEQVDNQQLALDIVSDFIILHAEEVNTFSVAPSV